MQAAELAEVEQAKADRAAALASVHDKHQAPASAGGGGSSRGAARAPQVAWTGQALPEADLGALAAEVQRRGLVRRDNAFSSRHKGIYWNKTNKKWGAEVSHGGKREVLGLFATEAEAKARYDGRCRELGLDPDSGTSSDFRGVAWNKTRSKWQAAIKVDGKSKSLGYFEATARGEVDAALAYDSAARAAGRPEKANFETPGAASSGGARRPLEEAQGEQALPMAGGGGGSTGTTRALQEAGAGQALPEVDFGALVAEITRRGLVRRDNAFSSRHKGVSWQKNRQ
jgi:hypothetical protein